MVRPLFPRALCVALVLLVLASPSLFAAAGSQRHQAPIKEPSAFLGHAWSKLVSLMTQLGLPVNPTDDNGSTMDPNGRK